MTKSSINKFLALLMFCTQLFMGCSQSTNNDIGQETEVLALENGLNLVVTKFKYGLNGQHTRLILSADSLRTKEVNPDMYPFWGGSHSIFVFDTLPVAILYADYEPENLDAMNMFSGKLVFEKTIGSQSYHLSKSKKPGLRDINE